MSDRFHLISMEQLTDWIFDDLEHNDAIFGVPRSAFFVPDPAHRFRFEKYGQLLESPFGVAAGPHSQMAQNIVVAWLTGARFIELKTIQTLDELEISKPCIDMEDEGYNVEWSQELKVFESFDEYLRAWVLIHALHDRLGFPGERPGMIFNMSVGYNLEGIKQPNVQWYFDAMADASAYKDAYVDIVARRHPGVRDLDIPNRLSDTITLSTMHGCPPDEIEAISTYLLDERELHTSVKANPTLLGADMVRSIVNDELEFSDVPIPDEAFGHDLYWKDAVPMLTNLRELANRKGLTFGIKLTNTLEVENWRQEFEGDDMMYMSGRALHAVTTNLASKVSEEFDGDLLISFAGGADCFNVADLLRSGMKTITVCSDLLKSGGYLRMLQYFEHLDEAMDEVGAADLDDFRIRTATRHDGFESFGAMLAHAAGLDATVAEDLATRIAGNGAAPLDLVRAWADENGHEAETVAAAAVTAAGRVNLRQYADEVRTLSRLQKHTFRTDRSKTARPLGLFDCIEAPCQDMCPINQKVPEYMNAVRLGDFDKAVEITREDNPLGAILGRVCDHTCEHTCIRTHYDEPLAIREMKRFIMSHEENPTLRTRTGPVGTKVAVIGAGPAGLSAAENLAHAGFEVKIFEMHPYGGGMVGGVIPAFRLPQEQIDQDIAVLEELGVEIEYGTTAGRDFTLADLREQGFDSIFVAVGAQLAKRLNLPGEDSEGVVSALDFLRNFREGHPLPAGPRVGVIGAGDTAMDCVRSAIRLGAEKVSLIYRRTRDQMPADRHEIAFALEEGAEVIELAKPQSLKIEDGRLAALECTRMEYRGEWDDSGRKIPFEVENSEFEIPLDTLILAISQHSILDFFGDEVPDLTDRGYIAVDPETCESSIPGVYAGGDVAADGPSSIVWAARDGQTVAAAIIERAGAENPPPTPDLDPDVRLDDLIVRRARREWRVPVPHAALEDRVGDDETILTYTPEQAMAEAARCLDCHEYCSLCVGVCPNLALMTYQSEPLVVDLPTLRVTDGAVTNGGSRPFRADQEHQIAVLTDFCNECGNCVTFCPTAGEPYRDKPRLYLNRADFEAEQDNAFMMFHDEGADIMEGRFGGETHRIELNGALEYRSPAVSATLDPTDFSVTEASTDRDDGVAIDLEPAASMYVILRGIRTSMPQLPVKVDGGTFVTHPGYEE